MDRNILKGGDESTLFLKILWYRLDFYDSDFIKIDSLYVDRKSVLYAFKYFK